MNLRLLTHNRKSVYVGFIRYYILRKFMVICCSLINKLQKCISNSWPMTVSYSPEQPITVISVVIIISVIVISILTSISRDFNVLILTFSMLLLTIFYYYIGLFLCSVLTSVCVIFTQVEQLNKDILELKDRIKSLLKERTEVR